MCCVPCVNSAVVQLESLAAVTCGICLFHSYTGSAPSPLPLPGATQLLQAGRLLAIIQAAAADAEAALRHYNLPPPGRTSRTGAAAGEAAGGLEGGSSDDDGCSSEVAVPPASVAAAVRLGAALFCSQAAVTLRRLAADLGAGLDCCRALSLQLEVLLSQVCSVSPCQMHEPRVPCYEMHPGAGTILTGTALQGLWPCAVGCNANLRVYLFLSLSMWVCIPQDVAVFCCP